jgi:phosphoglycolate phosphatase
MRTQIEWPRCRLVIFDVDGTLYDQRRLRVRIALSMAREAVHTHDLSFFNVIRTFRRLREQFAEEERADFEMPLFEATARACRRSEVFVRQVVDDWINHRPMPFLRACVFPHTAALFDAIRASGREIAVLSDYPATEKLTVMGLTADMVVSAHDPEVGVLKPNPKGLLHIMKTAGKSPEQCLFIGDRFERDGKAAERANVAALIRSAKTHPRFTTFRSYDDPVLFGPVLAERCARKPAPLSAQYERLLRSERRLL